MCQPADVPQLHKDRAATTVNLIGHQTPAPHLGFRVDSGYSRVTVAGLIHVVDFGNDQAGTGPLAVIVAISAFGTSPSVGSAPSDVRVRVMGGTHVSMESRNSWLRRDWTVSPRLQRKWARPSPPSDERCRGLKPGWAPSCCTGRRVA